MNLAKQINKKLDEILSLKAELSAMQRDVPKNSVLSNMETGDDMTLDDAVGIAEGVIGKVKEDLATITNGGQNVRNIFDNPYYINDMLQDKLLREEEISKENKLNNVSTVNKLGKAMHSKGMYNKLNGIKKMPNIED
jgi:hypothetical protein